MVTITMTKKELETICTALQDRCYHLSFIAQEARDEDRTILVAHCEHEMKKAETLYNDLKENLQNGTTK